MRIVNPKLQSVHSSGIKRETIMTTIAGRTVPSYVTRNVVIPETLLQDATPWLGLLYSFQEIVGDRVLVTSVRTSFSGEKRSGTSHPNGWALDVVLPDRIVPGVNPHFENDIYLLTYLASRLRGPLLIAAESDHLHIEISEILKGVYRYPTSRPNYYTNDKLKSPRTVRDELLWRVTPDSIYLMKDSKELNMQRVASERYLTETQVRDYLAKVTI